VVLEVAVAAVAVAVFASRRRQLRAPAERYAIGPR
jgi:hypothetical protein